MQAYALGRAAFCLFALVQPLTVRLLGRNRDYLISRNDNFFIQLSLTPKETFGRKYPFSSLDDQKVNKDNQGFCIMAGWSTD